MLRIAIFICFGILTACTPPPLCQCYPSSFVDYTLSFAQFCKRVQIHRNCTRANLPHTANVYDIDSCEEAFFYLNKKYNFAQKSILSKIFFILFSCIFTIFLVCDKKFHCLEQLAVCIQSHSYTVLLLRKEKQDFHRRRFWYTNTSNKQGGKRKWYLENCVT